MDRSGRSITNSRGFVGSKSPHFNSQSDQSDSLRPHLQPHSDSLPFSGESVGIDPKTKFLENEQIEGVHLVTDLDLVRQLHVRLGEFANGPTDFFPAMWPVTLSNENIDILSSELYDFIPRTAGTRYFMYIDSAGKIYLENCSQHIFRVDDDHAINMISFNGQPITDTVLDGIFTREKCAGSDEKKNEGRLTFIIHDAIRCKGLDLTSLNIRIRILVVLGYIYGTCYDVFQWSEIDDKTCNFRLKIAPHSKETQIAELHAFGRSRLYKTEEYIDSIALTNVILQLDGRIIECRFVDRQWVFVRQRIDRAHPNGRNAIENKLKVLENPITRQRLMAALDEFKGF